MAYLLLTGRLRAAVTAAGAFAATLAAGFIWLPGQSRAFWLGGVFYSQKPDRRPGQPVGPVAGRSGGPAGLALLAATALELARERAAACRAARKPGIDRATASTPC